MSLHMTRALSYIILSNIQLTPRGNDINVAVGFLGLSQNFRGAMNPAEISKAVKINSRNV